MNGTVRDLFHYPVKGLSAQRLTSVKVFPDEGFPFDRVFGFARHNSGFDPNMPRPLSKNNFLMLMKDERLAGLQTWFDCGTNKLSIKIQDRLVYEGNLANEVDIAKAVAFFSAMFDFGPDKRPVFAHAESHRFTDVSVVSKEMMNAVSFINLDSVKDLESRIGKPLHPLRFRANIYFDGWPPFSELHLIGKEISIGNIRLKVSMLTRRCAATEVDPISAKRDIPVPKLLMQNYRHPNMGIYAQVLDEGEIRPGDPIKF